MKLIITIFIISVLTTDSFAQDFKETYTLLQGKSYFKAKQQYSENQQNYSFIERDIIEAFLFNAFNKPSKSNKIINRLTQKEIDISDTVLMKLYHVQADNYIKLYKYREAKNTIQKLLNDYQKLLTPKESSDLENSLKIWTAFRNEPSQEVELNDPDPLKLKIDKAGLRNLEVRTKEDTSDFIFDTGANISTVTLKTANEFNMKVFPVAIEVGSITGKRTMAQLAICPVLYLGKIEIRNAIFLVFNDESLYIREIDYQINGIIGFPIIEALGEVTISQNDYFSVTKNRSKGLKHSNMALDGLFPLILLDGRHYTFDTGADETILYEAFYVDLKEEIEKKYKKEKISFSGAGGSKEFEGYVVDFEFSINGVNMKLEKIQLLTEKLRPGETVYGNIG